jgi:outer membrane biosynthesis protein TonB
MREGATLSALLHGLVILLLLIGLPSFLRRELEPPPIIPIEIVNISDLTQAPSLKVKPKDDSPKVEEQEKPQPPKPTPVAEKTPEPEPEPEKEPEKESEPELTMEDLLGVEEPVKEEKKEEKKKPEKKKPKKKKKPKADFMKLLNNIEETATTSEGPAQPDQDESSTSDHAARNISDILSVTELDLIRRQLQACWNVPAAAKDAKDLYVDVKVEMNPDATVRTAVVSGSNGNLQVAKDSALRAVKNPKCSPLKLPLDRYNDWKVITIRFDPQHIL